MKAWIVHDSYYGNGEKLAQTLGKKFEQNMDVKISHIKNITPSQVIEDSPDLIIVGGAVRKFVVSGASKRWIRKMQKELSKTNKTINFGATFLTHGMPYNLIAGKGKRFNQLLARNSLVKNVYKEFLLAQVETAKGPFKENVLPEVEKHANEILKMMEE